MAAKFSSKYSITSKYLFQTGPPAGPYKEALVFTSFTTTPTRSSTAQPTKANAKTTSNWPQPHSASNKKTISYGNCSKMNSLCPTITGTNSINVSLRNQTHSNPNPKSIIERMTSHNFANSNQPTGSLHLSIALRDSLC